MARARACCVCRVRNRPLPPARARGGARHRSSGPLEPPRPKHTRAPLATQASTAPWCCSNRTKREWSRAGPGCRPDGTLKDAETDSPLHASTRASVHTCSPSCATLARRASSSRALRATDGRFGGVTNFSVIGGICFRPFFQQSFAEIVFLARRRPQPTACSQARGRLRQRWQQRRRAAAF